MEKVRIIKSNGGGGATSSGNSSNKVIDRKTAERNRRIHMKGLCFRLTSLIPPHHFNPSREVLSQQDQLDQVAVYIKQLKDRVDELMVKKNLALMMSSNGDMINGGSMSTTTVSSFITPVVELRELGSSNIEVILISGLQKNFRLCDIVFVLQEEGTDVVGINMSTVGDRVFHTLHAQVKVCRVGVDTTKIWQRLQEVMCLAYLCEELLDCY